MITMTVTANGVKRNEAISGFRDCFTIARNDRIEKVRNDQIKLLMT